VVLCCLLCCLLCCFLYCFLHCHLSVCLRYCTVRHSTVLYCTILCCTVLYCTVLYCTALYCTVLYCAVLYCIVLYCTVVFEPGSLRSAVCSCGIRTWVTQVCSVYSPGGNDSCGIRTRVTQVCNVYSSGGNDSCGIRTRVTQVCNVYSSGGNDSRGIRTRVTQVCSVYSGSRAVLCAELCSAVPCGDALWSFESHHFLASFWRVTSGDLWTRDGNSNSSALALWSLRSPLLSCALLCRAVMLSGASNRTIFWRVFGELLMVIFGFGTEIPTLPRCPSGASDLLC
jgi:hypothetical protein